MKTYTIPHTDLEVSRIAYGCMGLGGGWDRTPATADRVRAAVDVVLAAYDQGIR